MKGYKVFNSDWTCKGFQYKVGETYEIDGKPTCCKKGFHFCKKLVDCFNYYSFDPNNKVAEIECLGDVDFGEDKYCTNKIKIIKELSFIEDDQKYMETEFEAVRDFCEERNFQSGE